MNEKPVIAITMGDAAGIGPEIIVKALAMDKVNYYANCIVIGDKSIMSMALEITGSPMKLNTISDIDEAVFNDALINLVSLDNIALNDFSYGHINPMCGTAAYEYICYAVNLCMQGKCHAVATAPINKEAIHAANIPFIGHTEIFAALTKAPNPLTMFETNGLRIFFFTRHLSMKKMLEKIKKDSLKEFAVNCKNALSSLGINNGTMAMAGLNPHCGEHGLFGDEEINEIIPAIEELRNDGVDITGPIGADSVFHQAAAGKYNCVLSLYHDQGHIAAKTLDFERTISITCSMPILRTSVDHGTAFDIAGKNIASGVSCAESIILAARYAPYFNERLKINHQA